MGTLWPSWMIKHEMWVLLHLLVSWSATACRLVLRRICCPVHHRLPCHTQLTVCPIFIQLLLPALCLYVCSVSLYWYALLTGSEWRGGERVSSSGTETVLCFKGRYCILFNWKPTQCVPQHFRPCQGDTLQVKVLCVYKMRWGQRRVFSKL